MKNCGHPCLPKCNFALVICPTTFQTGRFWKTFQLTHANQSQKLLVTIIMNNFSFHLHLQKCLEKGNFMLQVAKPIYEVMLVSKIYICLQKCVIFYQTRCNMFTVCIFGFSLLLVMAYILTWTNISNAYGRIIPCLGHFRAT